MTSQLTSLSEQHVTRHARHTIPPRPLGCPPSPCPARHFKPGPAAIPCLEAGPTLARQQRAGIPRPWASPHAGGRSTTRVTAHTPPPARPPPRPNCEQRETGRQEQHRTRRGQTSGQRASISYTRKRGGEYQLWRQAHACTLVRRDFNRHYRQHLYR